VTSESTTRREQFVAKAADAGQRVDRFLAARLPELSRTRIQELIAEGRVRVDGAACKASHRLVAGERVEADAVPRPALRAEPEAIPLEILYEDDDVVVVNKPAGMTVHAGAGAASARGTLVNALLHRYRELAQATDAVRPGIVHRLDKTTSGAILVARNEAAHRALAEQFRARRVRKAYLALVHGRMKRESGRIELRVARDLRRRRRMTTRRSTGRTARTDWRVLLHLGPFTLVEAELHTGRTHQIRVHFSALGHPLVGDTLYGAPRVPRVGSRTLAALGRNFLHAARIRFEHPRDARRIEARAPLPGELRGYLENVAEATGVRWSDVDAVLRNFL
jgi:23S rRNA pseudouridine1911/1915/1917 synthase